MKNGTTRKGHRFPTRVSEGRSGRDGRAFGLVDSRRAGAQLPDATEPDPRRSVVEMKVNGVPYRQEVPNSTTLLQFLREDLKLTAARWAATACSAARARSS